MDPSETLEAIQARHRKEQRDLQARITQKKKSATRKTRKGVNDECATLETELRERQKRELAALNGESGEATTTEDSTEILAHNEAQDAAEEQANGVEGSLQNLSLSTPAPSAASDSTTSNGPGKKPNRAKARLARRAAEQEAIAAQAAAEAAALPDLRQQERTRMREHFAKYGLQEKEIRADGHCLYAAVADQLEQAGLGLEPRIQPSIIQDKKLEVVNGAEKNLPGYKVVRHAAADFIEQSPDGFVGFMEEPLDEYLQKIRDTGEWGGHMELTALAKTYGVKVHVLHGDGTVNEIAPGEDGMAGNDEEKVIWLGYYRHGFGLGEHYNSLRKVP
ncbi:cysteine proteinase [Lepidopterella palustris CBS 459.81]|uniref:Cysteine proteinase n=1 Tax=Lepidopterella palustris CBS 459.81 TaxID=1314670 RepID=A0A8E2E559_9PEZI|nr:cysteine proteinase [Lepidopterella palustris CBS 459.81]